MDPGIVAQAGFEFQKLVFIVNALMLSPLSSIVYEGIDDVDISHDDNGLGMICDNTRDIFIQVKSGEFTNAVLEKVFINWLLFYNVNSNFICYAENNIDIKANFALDLLNKIKTANARADAKIVQVKTKYAGQEANLLNAINNLINKAKFEVYDVDALRGKGLSIYSRTYSSDVESDIIRRERFESFIYEIKNKISDSIEKRKKVYITL